MSFTEVRIVGWEKYNVRKDIKNPWWFKLSNSILEDADIYDLNGEELKAWIYILSQASKQQSATARITFSHATRVCGVNLKSLKSCITKLSIKQILTEICTQSVQIRTQSAQQIRREEIRKEENNTYAQTEVRASVCFDFSNLYASYPRKEGKSLGLRKLKSAIKTLEDFEDLKKAIDNYSKHCQKAGTEKQYIKHFSTFVSEWRDWLDPETGTAVVMKKKSGLDIAMERIEAQLGTK